MVITEGQRLFSAYFECEGALTQAALAKLLDVKPSSLNAWKVGHTRPESHYRKAIERHIGIRESEWMTDRERTIAHGADDDAPPESHDSTPERSLASGEE